MEKNLDIRADERNYRIHPRDIDRLSPSIGEVAYVDAYGDGHYKPMILASITPHYVTFRKGTRTGFGWVEVKVSRRWKGLGFAFALWRSPRGRLHCQLQEAERKEDVRNIKED